MRLAPYTLGTIRKAVDEGRKVTAHGQDVVRDNYAGEPGLNALGVILLDSLSANALFCIDPIEGIEPLERIKND